MEPLASALNKYLTSYFVSAWTRDSKRVIRPVMVGPPAAALTSLFRQLTNNETTEWTISVGTTSEVVPVLLIDSIQPSTGPSPTTISRRSGWDYAVTVRNSRPATLILASPESWDSRPESLANTTETVGHPGVSRRFFTDTIWPGILASLSIAFSMDERSIRQIFTQVFNDVQSLDPVARDSTPWRLANALLVPVPPGESPPEVFAARIGVPPGSTSGQSYTTLRRVADLLGDEGLSGGIGRLRRTAAAQTHGLDAALAALEAHLQVRGASVQSITRAPTEFYRPDSVATSWWVTLTAELLGEMLNEFEDRPLPPLALECENALNAADRVKGEPFIVADEVRLALRAPPGGLISGATFERQLGRQARIQLLPLATDPEKCADTSVPAHTKALRYRAGATGFQEAELDVLSLDHFDGGVVGRVLGSDRSAPPARNPDGSWGQRHVLSRGGRTRIQILHSSGAQSLRCEFRGASTACPVGSPNSTFLDYEIEDEDELRISPLGGSGQATGPDLRIVFDLQEPSESRHSRFEALLHEHVTGRACIPRRNDTFIERLEANAYLTSADSWRPVVAGFSDPDLGNPRIDWNDPKLGDLVPQPDSRPVLSPPPALIAARDAVRTLLAQGGRSISEAELSQPDVRTAVTTYLEAFFTWASTNPSHAAWFDCIALYGAEWNTQANIFLATHEPVAMLLSSLHPIRLAWHVVAQSDLTGSLARRCRAARVLDPVACPDAMGWPLERHGTQAAEWRAFLSIPCANPHWAVLLNASLLQNEAQRHGAQIQLARMGLGTKGIVGGFTSSQAEDSAREVSRLLPARATLRIGLAGTTVGTSASSEGLMEWCEEALGAEEPSDVVPNAVDIFDSRGASDPSPERVASLSEATNEAARWFRTRSGVDSPHLDLTIIDELGTRSPEMHPGPARSPMARAGLFRVRIRSDYESARLLSESRIGRRDADGPTLENKCATLITLVEELALRDNQRAMFRFRPTQEAIGTRLDKSTFLAVTSSEVDPACIVRGALSQNSYLWNYELPGVLGGAETSVGYYLIARPTQAMEDALVRSARLITPTPPPVGEMLQEISKHGIPILKRLASGGSESRGELGLFLAVRLLQDAFRGPAQNPALPVWDGESIHLILPVDPYEEAFDAIRDSLCSRVSSLQRPDLLVVSAHVPVDPSLPVGLHLVPVEVKFRANPMGLTDLADALAQAKNLATIIDYAWIQPPATQLWQTCMAALLAQMLDFAFRIYGDIGVHKHTDDQWRDVQERVLADVLSCRAKISVEQNGRLVCFDNSAATRLEDADGDGRVESVVVSGADAAILLAGAGQVSAIAAGSVGALSLSHALCSAGGTAAVVQPPVPQAPQASVPQLASLAEPPPSSSSPALVPLATAASPVQGPPVTPVPTTTAAQAAPAAPPSLASVPTTVTVPGTLLGPPRLVVGWATAGARWAVVGGSVGSRERIAIDLDNPKTIGIFGYMGSGKSYLLGTLVESASRQLPGLNTLAAPLATVIFNYRRNASDRFELNTLAVPNDDPADVARLQSEFNAVPAGLADVHAMYLPGELTPARRAEYGGIQASEMLFRPNDLSVEDWELLMGEPGSDAVFARTIRNCLVSLRDAGPITLQGLENEVAQRLSGQSRSAARLRFDFVRRYLSETRGVDFSQLLRPGRVLIIDLRAPLFNKDDALRFFLVCANQISAVQGQFNKMVIFDEAHEYLSEAFGERMEARIRQMRHEGTTYVFATQDVGSIPMGVARFVTTRFVFDLGTRENVADIEVTAPEFRGMQLTGMRAGHCLVQSNTSSNGYFARPREIVVRPRVTAHGGRSRIYTGTPEK